MKEKNIRTGEKKPYGIGLQTVHPAEILPADNGHIIFEARHNGNANAEEIFSPQEPDLPELEELGKDLPTEYKGINSLALFLSEIRKFKLLSADEEKELGTQIFLAKLALRNLSNILDALPRQEKSSAEKILSGKRGQRLLDELDNELKKKPKMIKKKEAGGKDASSERLFLADVSANDEMVQLIIQRLLATEEKLESQVIAPFAQQQLRFAEEGFKASELLTNSSLRLAVYFAKKYQGRGLDFEDLISYAIEGLISAADRFDYRTGNRFSSYSSWYIRGKIMKAIFDHGSTIRIPEYSSGRISSLRARQAAILREKGENIPLEELLRTDPFLSDNKKTSIIAAIRARTEPASLDNPFDEEDPDSLTLEGTISAPVNVEDETLKEVQKATLNKALLAILTPKQYKAIHLRFGLDGNGVKTFEQIAREFGDTKQGIAQLVGTSLRKLRRSPELNQLFSA